MRVSGLFPISERQSKGKDSPILRRKVNRVFQETSETENEGNTDNLISRCECVGQWGAPLVLSHSWLHLVLLILHSFHFYLAGSFLHSYLPLTLTHLYSFFHFLFNML